MTAVLDFAVGLVFVAGLVAACVLAVGLPLLKLEGWYSRRRARKARERRPGYLPVVKPDVDEYAGFDRGAP